MSKSKELFEQVQTLFEEWKQAESSTTKKSFADARKAAGEIKKLITPYRQASVTDQKSA